MPRLPFRILSPTAILGYGFPEASLQRAAARGPVHLIAVDAGSIDPGPFYLATRSSFTSEPAVKRDLALLLRAALLTHGCPLVVGSCGGCGTNNQLSVVEDMIKQLAAELQLPAFQMATVSAELPQGEVPPHLREWSSLGGCPEPSMLALERSTVVAQMPAEPIQAALSDGADVVLCGRAYDPACFSAGAMLAGYSPALAVHAGKVLECGAIACEPGSGADCLVAELSNDDSVSFWAPNPARRVTPRSLAAHTLYEKGHSSSFALPGGVLVTSDSCFEAIELSDMDHNQIPAVRLTGSWMLPRAPTVKVEGAAPKGHKVVSLVWCDDLAAVPPSFCEDESEGQSSMALYGRDGVSGIPVEPAFGDVEAGVLMSVTGQHKQDVGAVLAAVRSAMLHCGYPGRRCTAGNLGFPLSPSDILWHDGQWRGVSVAGSREPSFVKQWEEIKRMSIAAAKQSVPEAFSEVELSVECTGTDEAPAGLLMAQTVGTTPTEAATRHTAMLQQLDLPQIEYSPPHGSLMGVPAGLSTHFTVQHIAPLSAQRMRAWFPIKHQRSPGASSAEWSVCDLPQPNYSELNSLDASSEPPLAQVLDELSAEMDPEAPLDTTLLQGATVVRSKNAGISEITYDIIFEDGVSFNAAKDSGAFSPAAVAACLQVPMERVVGSYLDEHALAIKITLRRPCLAGDFNDRDVYGSQQHGMLLRLFSVN